MKHDFSSPALLFSATLIRQAVCVYFDAEAAGAWPGIIDAASRLAGAEAAGAAAEAASAADAAALGAVEAALGN